MLIVDAHEDIAWNVLTFGRNYSRSVAETRAAEAETDIPALAGQTLLGWPDWIRGNVAVVFATLFATPANHELVICGEPAYQTVEEAHQLYAAQVDIYHRLAVDHPDKFYIIRTQTDLSRGLLDWQQGRRRVGLVLLMEGADAIREPAEVAWWYDQGLRIIGPAWCRTRYAGGTGAPGPLTQAGQVLLEEMAKLKLILDLSHLADDAVAGALAGYPGPVIASHANARALLPGNSSERHLTDETVRQIAARQGVIGLVLFNRFIKEGLPARDQVTLEDVVAHIDHYAQLAGHTRHLGLGSDFDGGYGLENIPTGLDSIADLGRLGQALDRRGYPAADIEGILGGNWLALLQRTLPD